ncbi:sialidase family protein [Streptomyces sp. NPDC002992]|uniref:sialidase family protein n=1 Tax=Streptomyces sp. NPDC002992 TaxID=3154273 RepID=UPI0033B18F62
MLPLSERRRPGARRFVLSAWVCALALAVLAALVAALVPPSPAAATTATTAATGTESAVPAQLSTPFPANTSYPAPVGQTYYCTRIPAVVTARDGALLAFAEGRVRHTSVRCHDVGHNDLVLRRSTDGGKTWQPLQVVVGATDVLAHGNPAPVVDAVTGRITLLYSSSDWNRNELAPHRDGPAYPRTVHAVHSMDGGVTWSPSVALPQLKATGWVWVSTGPGHGIQLTRGKHHGRLIVPGDHTAGGNTTAGGQLYYSDDGGLTWELGATSEVSKTGAYPGELTVAETVDGSVYVNARNSEPTRCTTNEHRLATTSDDGGATFTAPFTSVPNLDTSPVFGSLLRLHAQDMDGKPNRLLYSGSSRLGPSVLEDRRELAIRSSLDEGRTWQTVGTLVSAGRTGYSDLTVLDGGSIGVLYETGVNVPHANIVFTAFDEAGMDAARTELRRPRTTDTGVNAHRNHAIVHGGAQLGTRGTGAAMEFDGQDDYLRLVCRNSLRVTADFTVTAWFRHSATTGTLPIVWAYGTPATGTTVRHFSVRAEFAPGETGPGVLRATVGTDKGTGEVTLPSSYNDGRWHHVVFKRQGTTLVLAVDGGTEAAGGAEATATADAGSVTPAGEFNVHIGARPDFPNQAAGVKALFRGGLDDVRLYTTALSSAQALAVKNGALDVATADEQVVLGFSTLW